MAKECFCGCGMRVPWGRKRITNHFGAEFDKYLELFRGALENRSDHPEHEAALAELVATGQPLRDGLRDVIHGTLDRKQYDKAAGKAWLDRALEHRHRMAKELVEEDYVGFDTFKQAQLVHAGRRAQAVIVDVEDTGVTVNHNPRARVRLRVEPDGEEPFELERKILVSRLSIPRVGERVEVLYDPDDRDTFTFRTSDLADDVAQPVPGRLDRLEKLGELRASGVLTEAEFEAEKRRILDGG